MSNALRHVDAFIAPSLTSQRKHEQLGISGPIVHIPNFVSAGENGSGRIANRRANDAPYFLFVGRLERLKGLHTVIPTFERQARADLWIVGTGSEEARLRAMAQGIDRIRFLGHRSGRELEALYRNAVALIYPSANFQVGISPTGVSSGQGAPLVIIEAFSQKTPVIASRCGRIPALLEQTGGGLVYSTARAACPRWIGCSSTGLSRRPRAARPRGVPTDVDGGRAPRPLLGAHRRDLERRQKRSLATRRGAQ